MGNFIYRTIGVGSPFWKKKSGKIILEILRYTILIICIIIFTILAYYFLIGFFQASHSEDYTPGECFPYSSCGG